MFNRPVTLCLLAISLAAVVPACTSSIQPLRPAQETQQWVPDAAAATQPASQPATASADTQPATQPGHFVTRTIDPNQTARFIYKAAYDNIWQQATVMLTHTGFTLDRQDYRLGVITTAPLPSSQVLEFWKPQQVSATDAMENTINNQRRLVRVAISPVPDKPDFYEIAIQVLVERETNPSGKIGGPVFVEGSGFGRNAVTLRSDYATPQDEPGRWATLGHDPNLEKKLLDELFSRI